MTRVLYYLVSTIAVISVIAGAYYFVLETRTTSVEAVIAPPSKDAESSTPPKVAPDHGNFQRRFQPQPPPANGGKK